MHTQVFNNLIVSKLPGRCTGYPAHPPHIRTWRTTSSGSSVLILLTRLKTKQVIPRLAHSYAVLQTIDIYLQPDTHSAGIPVTRFVGSKSLPWILPTKRYARPPLPCSGSLGPRFPTLPVRSIWPSVLWSAKTAKCPSRVCSLCAIRPQYLARSFTFAHWSG